MKKQRDEKGRFLPGWKGGPGRPPKKKEEKYIEHFKKAITLEDWEKATRAVLAKAQDGDVGAWRVLANYIMGMPVAHAEIDVTQKSMSAALWVAFEKQFIENDRSEED